MNSISGERTPSVRSVQASHPSYPHPTLAEALCELHFAPRAEAPWQPAWFGELFTKLQPDFPSMEPQQILEVGATVGPHGLSQRVKPPALRMVYKHASRPHLVQLSPGLLVVNELEPYPGWMAFKADIERSWGTVAPLTHASAVQRLGLRYINRIYRAGEDEPLGEWLAESEYYPSRLLRCARGFLARMEYPHDAGTRLVVTIGDLNPDDRGFPFLLDFDVIAETDHSVDWSDLSVELERLHGIVWEGFAASLTPKFDARLRGEA